jgi:ClpP class serine protease
MKRTIVRTLLAQQRQRMRRLAHLLRREDRQHNQEDTADEHEQQSFTAVLLEEALMLDEAQLERAHHELGSTARMLDLLDELLAMQDYTLSQMGTFSQG